MKNTKFGLLGCASILGLSLGMLASTAAIAADETADSSSASSAAVGEVVVTARRVAENVQKIPLAVSAHSGAQIDRLVVNTVSDLNKLTAGLQVQAQSATRATNQPSIRGQGTAFGTGQSSVISYYAEVPNFGPAQGGASTLDLASLQVVKGPQGTLFGATATGGVLLFEPVKPTRNDFNGFVRGEVGNYSYGDLELAGGGAIVPDVLMIRLAGKWRYRHGFTTAYQSWDGRSIDVDNVNTGEWRFSAIYRPLHNVENYFMYTGTYSTSNGNSSPLGYADNRFMNPGVRNLPANLVGSIAAAYQFETGVVAPALSFAQLQTNELAKQYAAGTRATFYDYSHLNAHFFQGIVNQTKWDVTDYLTIRNIFGIRWEANRGPSIDVDGGDVPLVDTRAPVAPGTINLYNPTWAWTGGWPSRAYTDEIQLQGKLFDNRLTWQAGAYGSFQADRAWTPTGTIFVFTSAASTPDPANGSAASALFGSVCNPAAPTTPGSICYSRLQTDKSSDQAVYGQGTFAILDTLHLTGGVRHSWAARSVTTAYTNTQFVPFTIPAGTFQEVVPTMGRQPLPGTMSIQTVPTNQATTYTVALDWQATDHLLLYATNRTGYKPGGINGNAPLGDPFRQFGPENLFDVELGAKAQWTLWGMRGTTNLAIFHDEYSQIQTSSVIPGTATTETINAANALIQGVELEGRVNFNEYFELSGWFGYLDAHYQKYPQNLGCNASSEYWYTQCSNAAATLSPGTTTRQVQINNATGTVNFVDGNLVGTTFVPVTTFASFSGSPTPLTQTAKYTFSLQPTIHLKPWLSEDISITANILYTSSQGNPNPYPGLVLAPAPAGSIQPNPFFYPAKTTVDMHIDWSHIIGSKLDASLVITNVTNKLYNMAAGSGFTISGSSQYIYNEPRMFYLELTYPLGAGS